MSAFVVTLLSFYDNVLTHGLTYSFFAVYLGTMALGYYSDSSVPRISDVMFLRTIPSALQTFWKYVYTEGRCILNLRQVNISFAVTPLASTLIFGLAFASLAEVVARCD